MENCADAFDQPIDSVEHRALADTVWHGGPDITLRYWLGRTLNRNLFRESNESVTKALQQYFRDRGSEKGALISVNYQTWTAAVIHLRHRVEVSCGIAPTQNPRLVAAIDAVFDNPELSNSQLAVIAKTTEKQIARMSDVFVVGKVWRLMVS